MAGHHKQILGQQRGFTIVELLIVIVVIAILAAIVTVAYNGVTTKAQNSKRQDDLAAVQKAIEEYSADNGRYPATAGTGAPNSCLSSPGWNCWGVMTANSLVPSRYLSTIPQDPASFDDGQACARPNPFKSRLYGYLTDAAGDGYILGTYIPGLSTSDPHYFNGSQDLGCLNFANYLIRQNM